MSYVAEETHSAIILAPNGPVRSVVIWLHGLGADGYDFVPIVQELQLPGELGTKFVFPHAEHRPVTINNGFVMRAWYDISGFGPRSEEDAAGIRESDTVIRKLIDAEVAAGVPSARIVLAGFSQGGAIALHTGVRYPQRLAGILALSTYLPLRDSLLQEAASANRTVPILMCHGARDQVVPEILGQMSRDILLGAGYSVEWKSYPMEHQVTMEEVADIGHWLRQTLSRNN